MAEQYTVKIDNGLVRLYDRNDNFVRIICTGAITAETRGDEIVVQMRGGKKKIYSVRGFFIRNG